MGKTKTYIGGIPSVAQVGSKLYVSKEREDGTRVCIGCAAEGDEKLCRDLPICSFNENNLVVRNYIWVAAEWPASGNRKGRC